MTAWQTAQKAADDRLAAGKLTEKSITTRLYNPQVPDVDLFLRSSGE
ncbi:hypothetical protein [Brevibacterium ravenspurgense]